MQLTPDKIQMTIQTEYRPCLVNGAKAIFHKWINDEKAMLKMNVTTSPTRLQAINKLYKQDIIPNVCSLEKLSITVALVEMEDGTMKKADIDSIKFLDTDGLMYDYDGCYERWFPHAGS